MKVETKSICFIEMTRVEAKIIAEVLRDTLREDNPLSLEKNVARKVDNFARMLDDED